MVSPPSGLAPTPSSGCSVVIRSFNEERSIGRLLTGITQQTLREVEVILVDSGSTDATVAIASQFPVRVLHLAPQDFSFGRSLNLGCAAASHDLVALASAHVYPVYDDWLEALLAPFTDAEVCMSYGKQRGASTTKYSEHQIFAQAFPDTSVARQSHAFCNNANAAIRRAQWERQPYDEQLTGLEDLAWANAAMRQGKHIAYTARAEVIHVHHESPRNIYNRYRREALAHRQIYPEQRFGALECLKLASANVASDYYSAWREGQLRRNLAAIPLFRACQFLGAYRGMSQRGAPSEALKQTFYYPRGFVARDSPASPTAERTPIDYSRVSEA